MADIDYSNLGSNTTNPSPLSGDVPNAYEKQYPQVKVAHKIPVHEKIEQILLLVYFGIAALLLFRFVLSLFGANRASLFVNFVYQLTTPFMFAFEGMFGRKPQVGQFVLEFEVIVALLVYALVFVGIGRLVRIVFK